MREKTKSRHCDFNEAWFDFVFCEKKRKEKNENCEKKMLTYTQYVV